MFQTLTMLQYRFLLCCYSFKSVTVLYYASVSNFCNLRTFAMKCPDMPHL
jgi:hypothetical protein